MGHALWLGQRIGRFRPITEHPLFPELYARLVVGASPYRLAAWIQNAVPDDDPLGRRTMTYRALVLRLYRFRRLLPAGVLLARGYIEETFGRLDVGTDVITEIDTLIRYQKERISSKAEFELSLPLPLEQIGREIDRLRELLVARRIMSGAISPADMVDRRTTMRDKEPPSNGQTITAFLTANPSKVPAVVAILEQFEKLIGGDGSESPVM